MSNRKTSENSDSISLFPFLAVLLCTMGALLVLLVVLVQRAAERALLPDANSLELVAASTPGVDNTAEQDLMRQALVEIVEYQQQLDGLQAEGTKRLEKERLRLSHSEEHARRLQEELAKLAIAAEQLKQAEGDQSVDQEQAEQEVIRLEQLVLDTTQQLEKLREEAPTGKRSYAIIPYKGPNGTYRKPIYIECSGKGVTLHPEGLLLTADDFIAPNWPGNPLAAALRASREYLNDKAAQEGAPEPPDPYPLIIIRPSGIQQYTLARAAITSWDADYGYEFVEEDMKLSFPEAPDPQLARAQQHAVMNARDRLLHLVQSAPSRFRGMRAGGGGMSGGGSGPGVGSYGSGNGEYGSAGSNFAGGSSPDGTENSSTGGGNGYAGGGQPGEQLAGANASQAGDPQIGALAGGGSESGGTSGDVTQLADSSKTTGSQSSTAGDPNLVGSRYAQQGDGGGAGGQGSPTNAPSEPLDGKDQPTGGAGGNSQQTAGASGGGSGGSSGAVSFGSPTAGFSNSPSQSIADARGANWAVNQPRQKSVAIRRPISVVVRQNKMILVPTGNARRGLEATGQEISLDQPIHDISDSFATAVRDRIEEWGLAGSGMYWRPVLELNVEPDATMTATRIVQLLKNSGVEVRLPETANSATNGSTTTGGTVR
ncbi:MAG: hypothetical protein SH868_03695 [Bythopirellula sp.]|nr:hypothetical protein [Bythopirellula sp.]